jgi:hypothetical protein
MAETLPTNIEHPKGRPFDFVDGIIFVIAFGLGLALTTVMIATQVQSDSRWLSVTLSSALFLGRLVSDVLLYILFFLLLAFVIVRLRQPRPAFASLDCQPGFVACGTPIVIILVIIPLLLLPLSGLAEQVTEAGAEILLGWAVPLEWIILWATHRWKPEPSWIDRLGRILGVLVMLVTPACFLLSNLPARLP